MSSLVRVIVRITRAGVCNVSSIVPDIPQRRAQHRSRGSAPLQCPPPPSSGSSQSSPCGEGEWEALEARQPCGDGSARGWWIQHITYWIAQGEYPAARMLRRSKQPKPLMLWDDDIGLDGLWGLFPIQLSSGLSRKQPFQQDWWTRSFKPGIKSWCWRKSWLPWTPILSPNSRQHLATNLATYLPACQADGYWIAALRSRQSAG